MADLKKGDKGTEVRELQIALQSKGFDVGIVDGVFGTKTEVALKEFQKQLGVTADGVLGSWVASKLLTKTSVGKIITITAGHNNKDPGAVNGKVTEANVVTDMRNIVAKKLRALGHTVRTDGEGGDNKTLSEAVKLISGSVIAVEFHLNAAASKSAGGVEALSASKHKKVSQDICLGISKVLGNKTRGNEGGWKPENSGQHSRLAFVSNGGIILETFFVSNDSELAKYNANKDKVCDAIVEAIIKNI